jgi:hypothetical protein
MVIARPEAHARPLIHGFTYRMSAMRFLQVKQAESGFAGQVAFETILSRALGVASTRVAQGIIPLFVYILYMPTRT